MSLLDIFRRTKQPTGKPAPRLKVRGFESAAINRLTSDWATTQATVDSYLRNELHIMRARSRNVAFKNPYASKFLSMLKANVLGSEGLMLKNRAMDMRPSGQSALDVRANKTIEDAWWAWGNAKNCTVSGDRTWVETQGVILDTLAVDGEVFIKLHPAWNNDFGFAIELIPAERVDHRKNEDLNNGNTVRLGVELDMFRRRKSYYLHERNPDDDIDRRQTYRHIVVPAKDMIHAYVLRQINQTRGIPWLDITLTPLHMLGGYQEAELIASRASAQKLGFFEQTGESKYSGDEESAGARLMDSQPGSWETLPAGFKVAEYDPQHPNSAYGQFTKDVLRSVAAGLNVSYNTLANDLEGVNFSSGRLGLMDEREFWKCMQVWTAEHIHARIFEVWLQWALDTKAIKLPAEKFAKFNAATWQGRRWQWVDPTKEVSAKIMELNSGLTSHSRVLAEQSIDEDELLDEIAAWQAKIKQRGLAFSETNPAPEPEPMEVDSEN